MFVLFLIHMSTYWCRRCCCLVVCVFNDCFFCIVCWLCLFVVCLVLVIVVVVCVILWLCCRRCFCFFVCVEMSCRRLYVLFCVC